MRSSAVICALIGLALVVSSPGSVALAQNKVVMTVGRGPQFLVAARQPSQPPVPVDAASVPVLRRRVSLDLQGVSRADALDAISRASGLQLVYANSMALGADRVRLKVEGITVAAALTEVLLDAGVDVLLAQSGDAVLVKRTAVRVPAAGTIVGRVADAKTGEGISSAEVYLDASRWRTSTDSKGHYRLDEVEPGSYALIVRRLGYAKQSRQVAVREAKVDTVNLALQPVAVPLDELVATATGQQRRRDIGNAITTIRADSVLQSAPIRNLTDLLEHRVPGMTVQHTSGAPGDPSRLRLRGLGSVRRSNDPVVVVDGVRIDAAQSEARSGNLASAAVATGTSGLPRDLPAPSPLDQIDPNIIEKVEVFKGPSAATLYGADAANGVIVITTKRGKPGPTRWNASVTRGRTTTPGRWAEGYYRWGHSLFNNAPQFCPLLTLTCEQDSLVRFQALNDPALTVLGQGRRTALSLTASGGNQALTYSITGTYDDEIGLLQLPGLEVERFRTRFNREAPDWARQPHHLEKWSISSRVNARLGATADVTLSTTLGRSEQQRSTLEQQVSPLAATYVDVVNGIYYTPNNPASTTYQLVPNTEYLSNYYARTTASSLAFTTGLNATWRPKSWLNASSQAGVNVVPRDDESFRPAGLTSVTDSGALARGTGRSIIGTFNVQAQARKALRWGFVFETSVGANISTRNTADLGASAERLRPGTSSVVGAQLFTVTENRTNTSVFGWYIEPRLTGQRLSLSTGLRLDGGSAYGTRLTGGLGKLLSLPKLNGSWVISEEPFFPFKGVFSSLRLRGAYGQAQVQPGPADRLRLYQYSTVASTTVQLTAIGNTQLRPERSTELEGGFDADLLDGRVSLEFTAYRKMKVDALLPLTLPPSVFASALTSAATVLTNIGNIRNQGLEVTLGLTPVRLPALTWSTQLNYARNTNTLVKLGRGVLPNKSQGLVEGYPLNGRWARPILGYDDANSNGRIEFEEIQIGDSALFMGRIYPAYTMSLHSNVALFGGAVGVAGTFSYDAGATQYDSRAAANWVLARGMADPSAPLSEQAAAVANRGVADGTAYGAIQDVSTFRFHSLAVNYRAPAGLTRLLRAQQMTVSVQGSNLGLHSTYRGKDPNVNSWSPGEGIVDGGQLPFPRTWQLAVFLQY